MSDTISIQVASVKVNDIKQLEITDKYNAKLCLWLCDAQIAASLLKKVLSLDDLQKVHDLSLENGGLEKYDSANSDNGFVASHEKVAAAVGLTGYTKVYEPVDASRIFALLQWGSLVELRHVDHHSMLATGWYKGEDGKFYCTMSDPWPYTNDGRFDAARNMTQRKVGGQWVDDRPIEKIGWFKNNSTGWV